jgi:protein involved in polysaccharide export with SLBB domain/capsular polysaccharide biosynthesis protein
MNLITGKPLPSTIVDPWTWLDFGRLRWWRLAGWMVLGAAAGALAAYVIWGRSYTATAELIHYEPSAIDDTFHPRDLATPSLVVMLQAPGMLQELGAQLSPPVPARVLADRMQVTLDRNNEVATVTAMAGTREGAADLVQRFCAAAIAYTQAMQRQEAIEAGKSVNDQLAQVEHEITATRATIPAAKAAAITAMASGAATMAPPTQTDDLSTRIQTAREELDDLLVRYTDSHPLVLEQRARLAALEDLQRRAPAAALEAPGSASTSANASAPTTPPAIYGVMTPEEVALGERLRSLETSRALLLGRRRAIQPFRDDPPGYFRVLRSAAENPIVLHSHRLEVALGACLGAFLGFFCSGAQIVLGEFLDNRIKSRSDLRRITGLPLVAALGDLKSLSPTERDRWAFRAWMTLLSRLNLSPEHGLICGIASAQRGEGRSTWIELLAGAATAGGFRVLTIAGEAGAAAEPASLWTAPEQLAQRLREGDRTRVLRLALPRGEWNAERRQQWRSALQTWRAIDRLAIFIELPPVSSADAILLAENVPNILWLVDSGKSDASEAIADLATLRASRCHLVGAALNRESAAPVRSRFSRWVAPAALIFALSHGLTAPKASAQDAFSAVGPESRADWQRQLTLGPGDVLSFHFFGAPELAREEVPIGPDGRISYLEAENIMAAGLTVDQLRVKVNDELRKYRRAPQAYVTPEVYHSKKYYMLGTVVATGVYYLEEPVTVLEAVARARGFSTGVSQGETVEITDFSHSFLERGGQRMPVDFERLFLRGDLSQNIALQPGDYLYFPPATSGDIYVLGEVVTPGAMPFDSDVTALSAIASAGGFTARAWKKRVLVVRGSLDHPQALRVDVAEALKGQAPNLALQPGDLVYVSSRPWAREQELLDHAAQAFVESTVVTWTGLNVGPNLISKPKGTISP